jgi:hypothetical protein
LLRPVPGWAAPPGFGCNVKPFEHTILVSCQFAPPATAKKDARLFKPGVFIVDYRFLFFPGFFTKSGK